MTNGIFGGELGSRLRQLRYGRLDSPFLADIRKNFTVAGSRPVFTLELWPRLKKSREEFVVGSKTQLDNIRQQLTSRRQAHEAVEASGIPQRSDRRFR